MVWGMTEGLGRQASWGGQKETELAADQRSTFCCQNPRRSQSSPLALAPGASCFDLTLASTVLGSPLGLALHVPSCGVLPSRRVPEPQPLALALREREAVSRSPRPPSPPPHTGICVPSQRVASVGLRCPARGRAGLGSIGGPRGSSVHETSRLRAWGWGFSTLPCAGSGRGGPGACHPRGGGRRQSVGSNDLQREQNHSLSWGHSGRCTSPSCWANGADVGRASLSPQRWRPQRNLFSLTSSRTRLLQ